MNPIIPSMIPKTADEQYRVLAEDEGKVVFGGRLGQYRYYDMDDTIASALDLVKAELTR